MDTPHPHSEKKQPVQRTVKCVAPARPAPAPYPPRPIGNTVSLKGVLGWIIGLAAACMILSGITALPTVLHSLQIWGYADNPTVTMLAHPANPETELDEEPDESAWVFNFRSMRDYRGAAEKAHDREALRRVVYGAPDVWLEMEDEADEEMLKEIEEYPGRLTRWESEFADTWGDIQLLVCVPLFLAYSAGGVLTMVLLGMMVHNARVHARMNPTIVDPQHSAPGWAVSSITVPFVGMIVPVRELWLAWRRLAASVGERPNGWLVALWWGLLIISTIMDHISLRLTLDGHIPTHGVEIATDVLDFLFYVSCFLLFHRIRKTVYPEKTAEGEG